MTISSTIGRERTRKSVEEKIRRGRENLRTGENDKRDCRKIETLEKKKDGSECGGEERAKGKISEGRKRDTLTSDTAAG